MKNFHCVICGSTQQIEEFAKNYGAANVFKSSEDNNEKALYRAFDNLQNPEIFRDIPYIHIAYQLKEIFSGTYEEYRNAYPSLNA